MKPIAYALLILLGTGLSACGQKGALFLAEDAPPADKSSVIIDNPNARIKPDVIEISGLTISGKLTQLSDNNAAGWELILPPLQESTNLVRYVAFTQSPVGKANTTFTLLIGSPQEKIIKGQTRKRMPGGKYLRFSSLERGVDQIPTLLNRVNSYFAETPRFKHGQAGDFIIENNRRIDLYISVEKTQ